MRERFVRRIVAKYGLAVIAMLCLSVPLTAQQVVIDWSNTANPLIAAPSEVNRVTPVIIVVRNVNDLLYKYRVDVQEEIGEADDLSKLIQLLKNAPVQPQGSPPQTPCETANANATQHLTALNRELTTNAGIVPGIDTASSKPKSIPLEQTVAAWTNSVRPLLQGLRTDRDALISNNCADAASANVRTAIESALSSAAAIDNAVSNSKHELQVSTTLSPGNKYTVTISEFFNNVLTTRGSVAVKFAPATNLLTLSGGVLFTEVKNPSYVSRPAVAPATGNVLSVEDTGPVRPALIALMNYVPPCCDWDNIGFAVSTGPVITFNGGKNDVSNLGYFAGISVHLYHRFYLTPGVHVGEFPDTPPGLSPGQAIPSSFGQLTPKKRWTLRFALAVSYKAKDFSGFTSGGNTPSVSQGSSGGAQKPKT